jgi:hypothetical protein
LMGWQRLELRTSCTPKRLGEELLRRNMVSCRPATQGNTAQVAGPRSPRCRHLTHPTALRLRSMAHCPPTAPRNRTTVGGMSALRPSIGVR